MTELQKKIVEKLVDRLIENGYEIQGYRERVTWRKRFNTPPYFQRNGSIVVYTDGEIVGNLPHEIL